MNKFYNWCIQHPIVDGVACGITFFIISSLLISFAFPAWALSIPITEHIIINLGDLHPWVSIIVAFAVYWEMRKTKKHALEAVAISKDVSIKVDGMLVDRDAGMRAKGKAEEKIAGEERAATLAQGQSEGRETALAATKSAPLNNTLGKLPLPVADDRTAGAAERVAEATERSAEAQQRVANVAEDKKS